MKNKLYILILILFFTYSCEKKKNIDYKKIDKRIECYENATGLFKFISEDRNEDYKKEVFGAVNKFIINLNYMTNRLMDGNLNENERAENVETLNRFINNNTKKCSKLIGGYELKSFQDSNYYYNMKINYIDCILKTSECIDSVNLVCDKKIKIGSKEIP